MQCAEADLAYVRRLVRESTAILLDDKDYLIRSRLAGLARRLALPNLGALLKRARADTGLQTQVVEAMTTNETSFFRDGHPFDALRSTILPALIRRRAATRRLSIWSAACSSGQEAYSVAMTLVEHPGLDEWVVKILATDVSNEMVETARAGRYTQNEIGRGLPPRSLERHFDAGDGEWVANDRLRALVTCRRLNLIEPLVGLPRFDLVFMRNVLIYFDRPTRREILKRVRAVMRPDALLILGAAETTTQIDPTLSRVRIGQTTCFCLRPEAWEVP